MLPTPRALALAGQLRQVLAAIEQITGPAEFEPGGARGTLRIATTDYGSAVLLPHVLAKLTAAAPGLAIAYTPISEDIFEHLKTGAVDLALTGQESHGAMQTETLFTERFLVATRGDHPLVGRRLTVDDYVAWPHVQVDVVHSRLWATDRALERMGRRRRIAMRLPHFLTAPFFAQDSDMLVPMPERIAGLYAGPLGLAIHEPPPDLDLGRFDYVQMWHHRRNNDPLHQWLRTLVRDAAAALRATTAI